MGNLKFYRDEPLFGLDIGHSTLKAMQVSAQPGKPATVLGYGSSEFTPSAIQNGVIIDPQGIAKAMHELFEKKMIGSISSRRVACSLPTSRTFSRSMKTPVLDHDAILEAVRLEAEQYIPIPINNLYLDYEIVHQDQQGMELLLVAVSKNIVDSYQRTLEALQLEPVAFEPSINAASRLVQLQAGSHPEPAIIVDFGSVTTDIAVFDKTLLVASTADGGGDKITELISSGLHLSPQQSFSLKSEYGISYSERQQRIIDAIKPELEKLIHEIQKSIRYYSERANKAGTQISKIITLGGGAVMPGLNQYLAKELRLPTETLNPWQSVNFGRLQSPKSDDRPIYITALAESLLNPVEVLT
jgi:type IV pilus assembly protein PilM